MRVRNKNAVFISIAILLTICAVVAFVFFEKQSLLLISPLVFSVLLLITKNIRKSVLRGDFLTVYMVVVAIIRYYAYPLLFSALFADSFYRLEYSKSATLVFIIEGMFMIIALDYFLLKRPYTDALTIQDNVYKKNHYWIIILVSIVALIVILRLPSVRYNYQFVWNTSVDSASGTDFNTLVESLGYVFVDVARLLLPLVIINRCINSAQKKGSKRIYLVFSMLASIIPMLVIKNLNRGSSFFTSLLYLWVVIRYFGWKKSKNYAIFSLLGVVALLLIVSAVKHAMGLSSQGFTVAYIYDVIQSYVLGVESIRTGLLTNAIYASTNRASVLFNDVFSSIPILNRLADFDNRYTVLYNSVQYLGVYNKNDAIAPLITHMFYFFGPIGFFIPILFIKMSIHFLRKSINSRTTNEAFIYAYVALILESGHSGSFTATMSSIIWVVLPLYATLCLMRKQVVPLGKVRTN